MKSGTTVNDVRHWLFCQKRYINENLPPTHDSFTMYLKHVNFQGMVWVRYLQPKQNLPSISGNGWYVKDSDIETVLMNKEPAPKGLIELTACSCKRSACGTRACYDRHEYARHECRQNELACTECCPCMADESGMNPENVSAVDDDDI